MASLQQIPVSAIATPKMSELSSKLVGTLKQGKHDNARSHQQDALSRGSVMTGLTIKTSETSSTRTTPKSFSARLQYLNSLGRPMTVLRPHPRNMVDSLIQLADDVVCIPSIKKALANHVKHIEKLVVSNRKAGAMMNKTMMYWRMLLKPKFVDNAEVMRMIDDVESKMARIKHKLDLTEGKTADEILPTQLYQCYLDNGMRIIIFDSNEKILDHIKLAMKMRKRLCSLQRKVNQSEYFENVKEWVMDAVIACYVIMAIDTVTALKLHPLIKDLTKNVKDGSVIEAQFVNRLRTFNVCLHQALAEAKMRRCQTLRPLDDILAKMSGLDKTVDNRRGPEDDDEVREFLSKLERIDNGEDPGPVKTDMDLAREKALQIKNCKPITLRNRYLKLTPEDLYHPFV